MFKCLIFIIISFAMALLLFCVADASTVEYIKETQITYEGEVEPNQRTQFFEPLSKTEYVGIHHSGKYFQVARPSVIIIGNQRCDVVDVYKFKG